MREYLPGEILMLVGHAKNKANDWLDRQIRMFEENAEDLRRLIVTLSDKDQFDPAIWREGYDETQRALQSCGARGDAIRKLTVPNG